MDLLLFPDKADKQLSANLWQEELEVFQLLFRRLELLELHTGTGKPHLSMLEEQVTRA